jgi:hypothetical protein
MTLKLLTGFPSNPSNPSTSHPPIWVNPEHVTHLESRDAGPRETLSGTYIYFSSSDSVAVREPIHIVVSILMASPVVDP